MSNKNLLSVSEFQQLNSQEAIHIKGMEGSSTIVMSTKKDYSDFNDNSDKFDESHRNDFSNESDQSKHDDTM